ncbi:NucA/NucB deoxyribonuclease domain-containing protein [Actinomadura kijaniata]|uniref:NucA/NucB deoxyribonuclease domain-containing protein n=1 Tax=Actinomadura kijaniata TaxID=46161 RepID=UPI003F1AF6D8
MRWPASPFTATEEGGTKLGPRDRGTTWIPSAEQRKQGGQITEGYRNHRIMPGDGYYVAV